MKKDKEILLTFYTKDNPIPIVFSVAFTMNFPKNISLKEYQKEWEEVVAILKRA